MKELEKETQTFLSRLRKNRNYRSLPDVPEGYRFGNHKVHSQDPETTIPTLSYENYMIITINLMTKKLDSTGKKLNLNNKAMTILQHIHLNILQDPDSDYNPYKGFYVYGPNSTGKSFALRHTFQSLSIARTSQKWSTPDAPKMLSYKNDIMMRARAEKTIAFLAEYRGSYYIDDLGYNDSSDLNLYGNKEKFLPELVNILYEQHLKGHRQHFTSNVPISEIEKTYGKGTADRLREMCNLVLWQTEMNHRTGKKI
jgi:DNA replication protein DnaC